MDHDSCWDRWSMSFEILAAPLPLLCRARGRVTRRLSDIIIRTDAASRTLLVLRTVSILIQVAIRSTATVSHMDSSKYGQVTRRPVQTMLTHQAFESLSFWSTDDFQPNVPSSVNAIAVLIDWKTDDKTLHLAPRLVLPYLLIDLLPFLTYLRRYSSSKHTTALLSRYLRRRSFFFFCCVFA